MREVVAGLLCACTGGHAAADMTSALEDSSTGLVGVLVGSELLAHVYDMPQSLRHSPNSQCGSSCPCVLQVGLNLPVQLTLDYAPGGCVPDSGLIPAPMAGHFTMDFDGATADRGAFQGLELALSQPVTGSFGGAVEGDPEDQTLRPKGDLDVGGVDLAVDLVVRLADDVRVDGLVDLPDHRRIVYDGVVLPWDAIGTPCPRPTAGTATWSAGREAVVHYGGSGDVTATVGGQQSDPVEYCTYSSPLW